MKTVILGHAYEPVVEAVKKAAELGTSYGLPTEAEVEMAELVCSLVPGVEMVRMVSSGTEAVLSALRVARGFTGRELIVKFEGRAATTATRTRCSSKPAPALRPRASPTARASRAARRRRR